MNNIKKLLLFMVFFGQLLAYAGNIADPCRKKSGLSLLSSLVLEKNAKKVSTLLKDNPQWITDENFVTSVFAALIELDDEAILRDFANNFSGEDLTTMRIAPELFSSPLLVYASALGRINAVKILLEKDVALEEKNKFDRTACWEALEGGHAQVVEVLLLKKANFKHRDRNGRTGIMAYSTISGVPARLKEVFGVFQKLRILLSDEDLKRAQQFGFFVDQK